MDKKSKRVLVVVGIVAIVVMIYMMLRGNNTIVRTSGGDMPGLGAVSTPGISIGERRPFVVPDFAVGARPHDYTMIGACCADCSGRSSRGSYRRASGPSLTFVTNRGDSGPVINNYYSPQPTSYVTARRQTYTRYG